MSNALLKYFAIMRKNLNIIMRKPKLSTFYKFFGQQGSKNYSISPKLVLLCPANYCTELLHQMFNKPLKLMFRQQLNDRENVKSMQPLNPTQSINEVTEL